MRLAFLFLLLGISSLFAKESYTQTVNFSLNMTNVTLEEVFDVIRKQSEFEFFYSNDQVNTSKKVSLKVKNASLEEILSQLLSNQYNYKIEDRYVLISKKNQSVEPTNTQQQPDITIKGRVTDENGNALIGVSVILVGHQSVGTVTNANGDYSIVVPGAKEVLRFSYLGYTTTEFLVEDQRVLNVQLKEETENLNEVVVVGYGTQKKVNLTGSVASVKGDVLETRPVGSVATGLQGLLPGVTITSASGQPGNPSVSIVVRGINTINSSTSPLILIDGVAGGDINLLNPDDIESVSVLKDAASSAIYGARAANGVIMITTKTGTKKEKTSFNYSGYFGIQTPVDLPQMVNGRQYMTLQNEAYNAAGIAQPFHEDAFMRYDSKNFPNDYSNTDWIDASYKKYTTQQNHNFNINGGSDKASYYMSYGYLDQKGLVIGEPYSSTRNNIRLRLNTQVFDRIKIDGNMGFIDFSRKDAGNSGTAGVFRLAQRISPLIPVKWQQPTADGNWEDSPYWSFGSVTNPVRTAYESGYADRKSKTFNGNFSAVIDLIKGMNINVQYAYNYWTRDTKTWHPTMPRYYSNGTPHPNNETVRNNISENRESTLTQTLNGTFNYETRLSKHGLKFLAGFSQEWAYLPVLSARRENILLDGVEELNAGTENITNSGTANHWALRSFFGRINYDYAEKYLFEANVRYDGTSRFSKTDKNRWGLFPSFSAGWKFTEEEFMEFTKPVLSIGKVRLSWGELGNQTLGSEYYPYLVEIERQDKSYPIGGANNVGFKQNKLANELIQWETIRMLNAGIDLSFLNNRLEATLDWFKKENINALLKPIYPAIVGIADSNNLPFENMGAIENKGWEVNIGWRDRIGKVRYGLTANLSDAKNKITRLGKSAPSLGNNIRREGDPINAYYGFLTDGLVQVSDFESYDENTKKYINPKIALINSYTSIVQPGDVKYRDISGADGKPDGKIDEYDKRVFGDPFPRYSYSLRGYVEWNNFDFQFYIQGIGKVNGYLTEEARHCFVNDYSVPKTAHLDRWRFFVTYGALIPSVKNV
ncbi:MAG: TonB-dependent receptor [Dysgonamonadaceae bacterium]|jgi:TonB-linked SusC/RagA family outer membrane protein|nr:TonB-dependent receptor [Dysgonamonadaceae bacterium]